MHRSVLLGFSESLSVVGVLLRSVLFSFAGVVQSNE